MIDEVVDHGEQIIDQRAKTLFAGERPRCEIRHNLAEVPPAGHELDGRGSADNAACKKPRICEYAHYRLRVGTSMRPIRSGSQSITVSQHP
jgi:hypothetical protein